MPLAHSEQRLLEVAAAVADGRAIDWAGRADTPGDAPLVEALRTIASIADALTPTRDATDPELTLGDPTVRELLPPRHQWGSLEIREHIGSGRFGDVYRAWDPALGRDVALKLLTADPIAYRTDDTHVVYEGHMMARVRHPNVVIVYGAQRLQGQAGVWMEFIRGRTLSAEFAEIGPFTAEELLRVGLQLAGALSAVHDANIVHRDVKAQNVMRAEGGRIVLGDFGIGEERRGASPTRIAGSPVYLAPEIFSGSPASPQSDIYSLGVLLFYLASGSYPYSGRSWQDIRDAQTRNERRRLADLRPDLPPQLNGIIERALESSVTRRFVSAAEMASALAAVTSPPADPTSPAPASRLRRFKTPAVVAGIIATVAIAAALSNRSAPEISGTLVGNERNDAHPSPSTIPPNPAVAPNDGVPSQSVASPGDHAGDLPSALALPTLNKGDTVLVTAFENRTGEEILDEVLAFAFSHDLRASPFMRVASTFRLHDALDALDLPSSTPMSLATARTVSEKDGHVRLIADGRVEKGNSGYRLTLQLYEPRTAAALWQGEDHVANHAALLSAIRERAFELRARLGEPRASVEQARRGLRAALSPSPAALRSYLDARREIDADTHLMDANRRQLSQRIAAIEAPLRASLRDDPDFAPALVMLAWALREGKEPAEEYLRLASRAKQTASLAGADQDLADGVHLDLSVLRLPDEAPSTASTETLQRAARHYEGALLADPQNRFIELLLQRIPRASLQGVRLGALRAAAADARPLHYGAHMMAAWVLLREGNVTAARRYAATAESMREQVKLQPRGTVAPVYESIRLFSAYAAVLEGNARLAAEHVERVAKTLSLMSQRERASLERQLFDLYLTIGQIRNARGLASTPAQRAAVEAVSRDTSELAAALAWALPREGEVDRFGQAWLLAMAGQLDKAEQRIPQSSRMYEIEPTKWAPLFVDGVIAYARGDLDAAISKLEAAAVGIRDYGLVPVFEPAIGFVDEALAAALIARGDWNAAEAAVKRGLTMPPFPVMLSGSVGPPTLGATLSLRALAVRIGIHQKPGSDGGALMGLRPLLLPADTDHPGRMLVDQTITALMKRSSGREGATIPWPASPPSER